MTNHEFYKPSGEQLKRIKKVLQEIEERINKHGFKVKTPRYCILHRGNGSVN